MTPERGDRANTCRKLTEMKKKQGMWTDLHSNITHSFQAQDGLLHTAHIGDVVLIRAQLSLLDPLINACDHVSGDVCSVIHT